MSLRSAAARLTGFSRRKPQLDAALQEEIRAHIELETQENVERGMPPAAARRAALLAFGNPTLAHEDTTAMWTVRAVESFFQDVRFGLRLLLKTPLLTIVALLSLTLGIGVTTATFILVNAGILRAFPFPEPRQLFRIEMARRGGVGNSGISQAVLQHWRSQPTSFSAIGAYRGNSVVVQSEQGAESVLSAAVAGDFFAALGTNPLFGRTLTASDDQPCAACPIVVSFDFWNSHLGGAFAPGRQVTIDGEPRNIVGVLPPEFQIATMGPVGIFTPLPAQWRQYPTRDFLWSVARLKDGASAARAAQELDAVNTKLAEIYPALYQGRRVQLFSLQKDALQPWETVLLLCFAAATLVLVIACANVAGVLLARGASRSAEVTIRSALGARRSRLVRQFVTETLVLALSAGLGGILLATAIIRLLLAVGPPDFLADPVFLRNLRLDSSVVAFTTAITFCTAILFSVAPAWQSSVVLPTAEALARTPRRRRTRNTLLVLQAALATVLLAASALLAQSFWHVMHVDPHFNQHELLTFALLFPNGTSYQSLREAQDRVRESVTAVAGVRDVAYSNFYLLNCTPCPREEFRVSDADGAPNQAVISAYAEQVSEQYFSVLGMRIFEGRGLEKQDGSASNVAVVNRTAAQQYFHGQAVGTMLTEVIAGSQYQIVGVVEDVKEGFLDLPDMPVVYRSIRQSPARAIIAIVRTTGPQKTIAENISRTLRSAFPSVPLEPAIGFDQWVHDRFPMFLRRMPAVVFPALAVMALLLTSLALYGVVSLSVAQRLQEIGVRVAMGATPRHILDVLLAPVLRLIAVGIVAGLVIAALLARARPEMLFGVSPFDPLTFTTVPAIVLGVAMLATFLPARRAGKVDPAGTLRCD